MISTPECLKCPQFVDIKAVFWDNSSRSTGAFHAAGCGRPTGATKGGSMLSTRLVRLIESHWEELCVRLINAVRTHPDMRTLPKRPDMEIREWCRDILKNLGDLLSAGKDDEVGRHFEILGKMRFEENIPLHEAVLRLQILKEKIYGFVHEQGFQMNAMQLYAEQELEQRIGRFFDACVYHVVCGYEDAMRWRCARLRKSRIGSRIEAAGTRGRWKNCPQAGLAGGSACPTWLTCQCRGLPFLPPRPRCPADSTRSCSLGPWRRGQRDTQPCWQWGTRAALSASPSRWRPIPFLARA